MDVGVLDVKAVQPVEEFALQSFAQDGGAEAVEDEQHANAPGIDHMRGFKGGQLALGADYCPQRGVDGSVEGFAQGLVAVVAVVSGGPRGCFHRSNTSMTIMRPPQQGHGG